MVTTNLAFINDEILSFLKEHSMLVSTSLDGPAVIHNANRPRPGSDSHEAAVRGIRRVREALGHDRVAAIMTTTRLSLQHPEAIVDEYVSHGFDSIFFRPISPYGFAVRTQQKTGYDFESFFDFYTKGLAHIIELNRRGTYFVASYAQLLLTKILTPFVVGRELGRLDFPRQLVFEDAEVFRLQVGDRPPALTIDHRYGKPISRKDRQQMSPC